MPDPAAPAASGAVFLSYAREDTAAARRIADALAAFGIEVWLDQSELRGGDTWDATIRAKIKNCALFLAVISANTQKRREGYFRREWHLAVERTLDMAHGTPFLVPVVVDDTPEAGALVPEQFMRVQWSRLPQGVPDARFVENLKRLLSWPGAAAPSTSSHAPVPLAGRATPARRSRWPLFAGVAAVVALVLGGVAYTKLGAKAGAVATDQSIAILPFTNMSDDRENAHFADGIHEELLTNLITMGALRVAPRPSTMKYRDARPSAREIAAALNVAYLLEGSVRRRGTEVRISVQLIDARTEKNAWAESFNKDLSDFFATQTEVATEIANQLKTRIASR